MQYTQHAVPAVACCEVDAGVRVCTGIVNGFNHLARHPLRVCIVHDRHQKAVVHERCPFSSRRRGETRKGRGKKSSFSVTPLDVMLSTVDGGEKSESETPLDVMLSNVDGGELSNVERERNRRAS